MSFGLLVRRGVLHDPWPGVLLCTLVLVGALVATLWPRHVTALHDRQVGYVLGAVPAQERDARGVASTTVLPDPGRRYHDAGDTWGPAQQRLSELRTEAAAPLASALGEAEFVVDLVDRVDWEHPEPRSGLAAVSLQPRVDPFLRRHATLTEGQWPQVVIPLPSDPALLPEDGPPATPSDGPVPVALEDGSADRLGWEVGETHEGLVLSGTFSVTNPAGDRWAYSPLTSLTTSIDDEGAPIGAVAVYLAGGNPGSLGDPAAVRFTVWSPLDVGVVSSADVAPLADQLEQLATRPVQMVPGRPGPPTATGGTGEPYPAAEVALRSGAVDTLRELEGSRRTTSVVLAVVAAGPVGVLLATIALAAQLLLTRRAPTMALARARGASPAQLRGALATEGLALGPPAALAGLACAVVVSPGRPTALEIGAVVALGLVPAAALVLVTGDPSLRQVRSDLATRSRSRYRWVVEVLVLGLAALTLWRLRSAGGGEEWAGAGAGSAPGAALVGMPILLALAVCVVVLRLYPLLVRPVAILMRRGRGLVPFLGAARAVRDSAGQAGATLVVVLGVGVAVFTSVLASTVRDGVDSAAWTGTGAQLQVGGAELDQEVLRQIEATEGVLEVATLTRLSRVANLDIGRERTQVRVVLVDRQLAQVQQAAPLVQPVDPAVLAGGDPVPILVGGVEVPDHLGAALLSPVGEVRVVGRADAVPGQPAEAARVVVSAEDWAATGEEAEVADTALVALDGTRSATTVAEELATALPQTVVRTPQEQRTLVLEAPLTTGTARLLLLTLALTTALTGVAVVLAQLLGARTRARLFAVLETMGARPGAVRALTSWELAPLLLMAAGAGTVLGVLVPPEVVTRVDLASLTGGAVRPPLAADPLLLGMVLAVIVLTVLLVLGVTSWATARRSPARALRVGDPR